MKRFLFRNEIVDLKATSIMSAVGGGVGWGGDSERPNEDNKF